MWGEIKVTYYMYYVILADSDSKMVIILQLYSRQVGEIYN